MWFGGSLKCLYYFFLKVVFFFEYYGEEQVMAQPKAEKAKAQKPIHKYSKKNTTFKKK